MGVGLVLLTALLGLLGYVFHCMRNRMQYWQKLGIPCEEPHILLGNMKEARTTLSAHEVFLKYYNKFRGMGPFVGFYFFHRPAVLVMDLFLVKQILIKEFNIFTDRGFFSNPEEDPLSGRLALLDGHKWRSMRHKLTSTFTSGKIKLMFPTVVKVSHEFVDVFGEMTAKSSIVEVKELLARFTTDVIGTCAFGIDCNSLKDPEAEFRVMGRRALSEMRHGRLGMAFLTSYPDLARRLHMKMTPDHIENFFLRIVKETVKFREENGIRRNDFMDQLIDLKNNNLLKSETGESMNLTIEEVTAQAYLFFNAGFETSSTTMGFALYELAQHSDIQQRMRDEVNKVLSANNGELTYEALKDMVYVNQVISEILRLYTVLPILSRQALEDYVVPGYPKYVIKKGMPVIIPAGAMHRDEKLYPNPNQFNPDNFEPERVKNRDSVEWLPFGDGPRNCIGMRFGEMQARIGLAMLVKNFKFSVCAKTPIPMKYNKSSFLLNSESGIFLHVERI
ncbi:probable cytochrome P450 6a21 [Drosophila sulfurigaster albostrigata]|uniref:probable cytochrome P450 6a21 n=1 Tax=Drosophila sulfurigaster albostrigata TaxID=89887 RepID=UPI002D21CE5D|nr:probable cytochrome P450 6a21 [Drosophila sulfurigaster albostrigata]